MWASALLRGPPCCAAARPQRVDHVATARPLSGPSLRPATPFAARRPWGRSPQQQQPVLVAAAEAEEAVAEAAPAVAEPAADAPAPKAVAHLRFSRGSPHKVRRVLDQIRGRSYEEALMLLEYMPFRACEPVLKTILSAAANAKNNLGMKKAKLYVSECFADGGPQLKRVRPRAKGRGNKILKPLVHMTVCLQEKV